MTSVEAGTVVPNLAERYRVLLEIGRTLSGTLAREDLYQVLYRETATVLEVSGFYVSLYDSSTDLATIVFYADHGRPKHVEIVYRGSDSEVIRTGRPTLVEDRVSTRTVLVLGDEQSEITRSAISAPLLRDDRVLGAISAQSYRPNAYTMRDLELLEGIASLAAVAIENAQYVAELEKRREEAERIEEIGRALVAALDPQEVLTKVAEACLSLLATDGSAVWLMDEDAPRGRVAASAGQVLLPVGMEWDLEGLLAERLLEQRAPLVLDDPASEVPLPHPLGTHQAGSSIVSPLIVGGNVGGLLWGVSRRGRRFSSEEARTLQRLASQASLALENARLHSNLQALSLTDPLTGLANRRHLQIHLEREVAAARRGRPVCAVILDLDDFKRHNDTEGHVVGDQILRNFARILEDENRSANLVARYGGDEFVSILSDGRTEGARLFISRVREGVSADPLLARYGVTVSAGLAVFEPARMGTGEDLLSAADADLYRHKAERRSPKNGDPS
jgi:diguanylate cyclase (GGDEF)-like protein